MKPKAVKGKYQRFLGSFSHKCIPVTVKEPGKSLIQASQPKTADNANDIEEKPGRNLDGTGVVGESA